VKLLDFRFTAYYKVATAPKTLHRC